MRSHLNKNKTNRRVTMCAECVMSGAFCSVDWQTGSHCWTYVLFSASINRHQSMMDLSRMTGQGYPGMPYPGHQAGFGGLPYAGPYPGMAGMPFGSMSYLNDPRMMAHPWAYAGRLNPAQKSDVKRSVSIGPQTGEKQHCCWTNQCSRVFCPT